MHGGAQLAKRGVADRVDLDFVCGQQTAWSPRFVRRLVAAAPRLVSFSGVVGGRAGALAASLGALPKKGTVHLCSAVRSWWIGDGLTTPPADIAALCGALEASATVESLYLDNAKLGWGNDWAASQVARMLAVNTSLRSLTVVELNFGGGIT